jgi:hypothetical protein
MSGEQDNCADHDWWFEVGDTCPVCEGINAEQARIINLLQNLELCHALWEHWEYQDEQHPFPYELIKGETSE